MGSGGSFVAILLSVPLTAVALVGVVGVPKLQELVSSASSQDEEEFDVDGFDSRARSKRGSAKSDRDKEEDADLWGAESELDGDLAEDFGSKPKSARSRSALARNSKSKPPEDSFESDLADDSKDDFFSKPGRGRLQNPREPKEVEMVSTEPFKSRSAVTTADHNTPAAPAARGDGFAAAVEKLRAMGVERFHLEPGLGAGQFLFVCQMEAAGEAGTVHRFEAESGDPTSAVADVMQQVSSWQAESSVTKTAGTEFRR